MTAPALTASIDADVIAPPLLPDRSNIRSWLAARRTGITGTDVAAILGMSSYKSALGVYLDKLGEIEDDGASEAAEWGLRLEPAIAEKFQASHSELSVLPSPGVLANRDRRWQVVNVDRLAIRAGEPRPRVVEIKTSNQWLSGEWDHEAELAPASALLQTHHEMAVTGANRAHLVALIGGQHYVEFLIDRDEEMVERLAEVEGKFWHDHVLARVPPPIDGSKVTSDLLGRLYEVEPESVAVLDPAEFLPLRDAYREAKAAEKAAAERTTAVANQLKALLGPKEIGVLDGQPVVTWKSIDRSGFTVAPTTFRKLHLPKDRP